MTINAANIDDDTLTLLMLVHNTRNFVSAKALPEIGPFKAGQLWAMAGKKLPAQVSQAFKLGYEKART